MRRRRGQGRRTREKDTRLSGCKPNKARHRGIMGRELNQIENRGHGKIVDHQSRSGIIRGISFKMEIMRCKLRRNGDRWQKKPNTSLAYQGRRWSTAIFMRVRFVSVRLCTCICIVAHSLLGGCVAISVDKGQHRGRESFPCVTGNSKGDHYQVGPHLQDDMGKVCCTM
jgi:hypothetical protein